MSEIKQNAVLDYIVDVLQNAIADSRIKKISPDESVIIDGNASITIKQSFESDGNAVAILISDKKEILYSEELLEKVYKIHEEANDKDGLKTALSLANMVINGLNIEAELIFYTVRDQFYALSSSYEFIKFIERNNQQMRFKMSFGDHSFELIIVNEADLVAIKAEFGPSVAPAIKETINADLNKVSIEINKQFK